MKEILAFITVMIFFPATVMAWNPILFSGINNSGADTDCTNLGTHEVYYDLDHSVNDTTACVSGGTITVTHGIFGTGGPSTDQNNTAGGANSFLTDSQDDNIQITNTSYANSTQGYVKFDLYPSTSLSDSVMLFELHYDNNNHIRLLHQSIPRLILYHVNNGSSVNNVTSLAPTVNAWSTIEIRWSVALGELGVRVNGGSWQTASVSVGTFSNEAPLIVFGEKVWSELPNNNWYYDNMYVSSTYTP